MEHSRTARRVTGILAAAALLAVAALGMFIFQSIRNENIPGAGESDHAGVTLEYDGEQMKVRPYIHTVLLIGTDDFSGQNDLLYEAPYNSTQADFVALFVFDLKAGTVVPIQLNRDAMCDVPYLSVNGKILGTYYEQLALSHTSGSGKEDSCRNVIRAVRNLLLGAPVDHFIALNMSAVPVINDLIGGVTLKMEEDYLDESGREYRKGDILTLRGEEALSFVRMRRHDRVDVNMARMARQRLYLEAFATQATAAFASDPELVTRSFDSVSPYMISDLDINSYSDFLNRLSSFESLPVQTLQGVYHMGSRWAEFYPDEDNLWEIVKSTFT